MYGLCCTDFERKILGRFLFVQGKEKGNIKGIFVPIDLLNSPIKTFLFRRNNCQAIIKVNRNRLCNPFQEGALLVISYRMRKKSRYLRAFS